MEPWDSLLGCQSGSPQAGARVRCLEQVWEVAPIYFLQVAFSRLSALRDQQCCPGRDAPNEEARGGEDGAVPSFSEEGRGPYGWVLCRGRALKPVSSPGPAQEARALTSGGPGSQATLA